MFPRNVTYSSIYGGGVAYRSLQSKDLEDDILLHDPEIVNKKYSLLRSDQKLGGPACMLISADENKMN